MSCKIDLVKTVLLESIGASSNESFIKRCSIAIDDLDSIFLELKELRKNLIKETWSKSLEPVDDTIGIVIDDITTVLETLEGLSDGVPTHVDSKEDITKKIVYTDMPICRNTTTEEF